MPSINYPQLEAVEAQELAMAPKIWESELTNMYHLLEPMILEPNLKKIVDMGLALEKEEMYYVEICRKWN